MCCTVTQHKFWFGRWVLTAGFDLTMSSCPASLRRFSSGTKFTEWDSTSGSTGDQLYHALPPPNSFLPHLPFSSTTYYIPTWSVWLSYLLLQNTGIFLLPPFNFHSLCSTILYFKIDDFTFSSFELWKKEIVWHASLPHAPPRLHKTDKKVFLKELYPPPAQPMVLAGRCTVAATFQTFLSLEECDHNLGCRRTHECHFDGRWRVGTKT